MQTDHTLTQSGFNTDYLHLVRVLKARRQYEGKELTDIALNNLKNAHVKTTHPCTH
jgi:hypothetical protein